MQGAFAHQKRKTYLPYWFTSLLHLWSGVKFLLTRNLHREVKKHTKPWNWEKTRFIIQTEVAYRCKTKPQFLFVMHSCSHSTLFVVSTAEEALMGFFFHFSFGEEAYGDTSRAWPDAFGCISVVGNSNHSFWRSTLILLLLHCPYFTMMDLFNLSVFYW